MSQTCRASRPRACAGQTFCAAYGNAVNDPTKHPERAWLCCSQGVAGMVGTLPMFSGYDEFPSAVLVPSSVGI